MSRASRIALAALIVLILVMLGLGTMAFFSVTRPEFAFSDLFKSRETQTAPMPTIDVTLRPLGLPTPPPETPDLPEATPPPDIDDALMGRRVNILALGYDMSAERRAAGSNARTDTMMLLSVDTAAGTVDIISLPRDSYVRLPDGNRNKINAAFALGGGEANGGFAAAAQVVSETLGGIPVDFYIGVDMNLFKQLVDALGGVAYDVDLDIVMNGRPLTPGVQRLNGQQVLDYCRFRHAGRGDIDRIDRQQRMMMAILDEAKQADTLLHLPEVIASVTDNLQTNLSMAQIGALAWIAKDIAPEDIHRYTLPGRAAMLSEISYWLIYQEEKQAMLQEIFGITVGIDMAEDASYLLSNAPPAPAEEAYLQMLLDMGLLGEDDPYYQQHVNDTADDDNAENGAPLNPAHQDDGEDAP